MRGLLVRVGIDATAGNWNGPVNPDSGVFAYVPIPENDPIRSGLGRPYSEVIPALSSMKVKLPTHLRGRFMHLDPDFAELTYGDCHPRSLPIKALQRDDFLVFYAGLRSTNELRPGLYYDIIGFYLIDDIVSAASIPADRWHENAHTRRTTCIGETVVRAQKGSSGRLARCIGIGEFRKRAYRVRANLLAEWGGLSAADGYIQRSARLPSINDPAAFLDWFHHQQPHLIEQNNE